MTGRQHLVLVYRQFAISNKSAEVFSSEDLLSLEIGAKTLDALQAFIISWDSIHAGIAATVPDHMLLSMFLRQVHVVPELEFDITLFDRLPELSRRRSYVRLRSTVDYIIDKNRVKVFREQTLNAQSGKKNKVHGAPAKTTTPAGATLADPKPKKGKRKKKDKARTTSPTPSMSALSTTSAATTCA